MSLLVEKWVRCNKMLTLPEFPKAPGLMKVETIYFPSNNAGVQFNYIMIVTMDEETEWSINDQLIMEILSIEKAIIHTALAFTGLSHPNKIKDLDFNSFPVKQGEFFDYKTSSIKHLMDWTMVNRRLILDQRATVTFVKKLIGLFGYDERPVSNRPDSGHPLCVLNTMELKETVNKMTNMVTKINQCWEQQLPKLFAVHTTASCVNIGELKVFNVNVVTHLLCNKSEKEVVPVLERLFAESKNVFLVKNLVCHLVNRAKVPFDEQLLQQTVKQVSQDDTFSSSLPSE